MDDSAQHNLSPEVLARFLGVQHASGPHELLGLPLDAREWSSQGVSQALISRLKRIDEHPQGRTPEADELRVALHVAAAQLRDPRVQQAILSESSNEHPSDTPGETIETDPLHAPGAVEAGRQTPPPVLEPPSRSAVNDDFRLAAEHVLATCGGWNAESKRLLGYLARSASVDVQGLQQALVDITRSHESPRATAESHRSPGRSHDQDPPAEGAYALSRSNYANRPLDRSPADVRTRTWMTIGTALMLACSGVMGIMLVGIMLERTLSEPAEVRIKEVRLPGPGDRPESTAESGADPEESAEPSVGLAFNAGFEDAVRLLRSLDRESFAAAPEESLRAFEEALELFATGWFRAEPEILEVAPVSFRDAVLAGHEHDTALGTRLVRSISSRLDPFDDGARILDPASLRASAFCFGICGMLQDSAIVPEEARRLRSRLNSIASLSGDSFEAGSFMEMIETVLRVQSAGLVPRAADQSDQRLVRSWSAWMQMCDVLPYPSSVHIKLDAIGTVVRSGEDPVFHSATNEVIDELVSGIDWLDDSERIASRRLLAWFDDSSSVDMRDLSVITEQLVDGAMIPSLDPTYMLSSSASSEDRLRLRDRYALQFSLPQTGGGKEFAADWSGYALELLEAGFESDESSALNAAVRAAWLNESAALWFASENDRAMRSLENARGSLDALVASRNGPVPFGTDRTARADGEWAARYLQARRSADERTNLLYELTNSGGPAGQADADVLAEAASYSTPIEIRAIAQRVVVDYSNRPEVILGLLEVIPRAAKQEGVSQMIRDATGRRLPPVERQDWLLEARKALVERAMELLVGAENRRIDIAAEALASTYSVRLELLPRRQSESVVDPMQPEIFDSSPSTATTGSDPSHAIASYSGQLETEAARYPERASTFATLTEIATRRLWRLRLVSPGIESFASEQTSALELHAYILSNSRPSLSDDVSRIIDDAAADRRGASSIFQQIAVNETAMLRLNLLRLTGGENQ